MGRKLKRWFGYSVMVMVLVMPTLARADFAQDAGVGTATVLANVVYMPAKVGYAFLGGLTGGFAYVLTGANYEVAEKIWTPSLGGHYVLSSDQLRGNQPIYFSAPVSP